MWGNRKNRRSTTIDTMIGPNTEVLGDMRFSGCLLVEGTIKGNAIADDDGRSVLSLTEDGRIEGEVKGPYLVLNGVVNGDVYGSQHVELSSKARITGNVYYNLIEMAIGAEVNGKLVHTPDPGENAVAFTNIDPIEVSD